MINKLTIRWRLTILSALLLTLCCVGLTIVLNYSAFKMADSLEAAVPIVPATSITPNSNMNGGVEELTPSIPLEELQSAKRGYSDQSIFYMMMIVLGGSALTYYIAGKALKPLDILSNQVKNLNVHNLSETLEVPSTKDEISHLTQTFNEMSDKLNHAFMTQKRFSANAAHELRTPLAILQTKLDVFKKNEKHTDSEYETLMGVFEKQIHRLRELVGNLLDMSNMKDDQEKSDISLNDIFEDILSELSQVANNKNITLSLKCDNSIINGNVDLLYRAFYNLVENAIKYNKDNGSVDIEILKININQVKIKIKDGGIGIPDEFKHHIFEPFYRIDKSRSRDIGGAGLGLSIVDNIIKKHHGEIYVYDNEDIGTCFEIIL